jgi:hypothetical protein
MKVLSHYRKVITFQFANGAAGAGLVQTEILSCAGELLHIHQVNGLNTGTKTAQLTIVNSYGHTLWDGTAKAHNGVHNHEFVAARRMVDGADYLRCTISGDPGVSGYKIDVVLGIYGRDA